MDDLREDTPIRPAYRDGKHFEHGRIVDELAELYQKLGGPKGDQPQGDDTPEPPMQMDPVTNEVTQTLDALEREWGSNFGANLRVAQSVVSALSQELGTDVADIIEEAGIGNNLIVFRTFYELGKGGSAPVIRRNEAAHLIQALQQTEAYRKAGPAHDLLVNVIQDLYQITNP
jgi:hypothetical protein